MEELKEKDISIRKVVSKLQIELGESAFDIVDHWEADLSAIGLARPDNHSVLVYISTCGLSQDEYFVSLELPPVEGNISPYKAAGEFQNVGFNSLVDIVKQHFKGW